MTLTQKLLEISDPLIAADIVYQRWEKFEMMFEGLALRTSSGELVTFAMWALDADVTRDVTRKVSLEKAKRIIRNYFGDAGVQVAMDNLRSLIEALAQHAGPAYTLSMRDTTGNRNWGRIDIALGQTSAPSERLRALDWAQQITKRGLS